MCFIYFTPSYFALLQLPQKHRAGQHFNIGGAKYSHNIVTAAKAIRPCHGHPNAGTP